MNIEQLNAFLGKFAAEIGEHFDSVQIMAEVTIDGATTALYNGRGSWYARQGMAHEFIEKDIAQEHAYQIAGRLNPPENLG